MVERRVRSEGSCLSKILNISVIEDSDKITMISLKFLVCTTTLRKNIRASLRLTMNNALNINSKQKLRFIIMLIVNEKIF